MNRFSLRGVVILVLMVAAAGLAAATKPRVHLSDLREKVNLESMVPRQFGDWRIDESVVPILPDPTAQALLDKLYNQTLARTYVNSSGSRIMLSIAYGGDQSDALQLHRPEVCYASQGFQVLKQNLGQLPTQYGVLPVKRLLARLGARVEPITYWVTVGDNTTYAGTKQKLTQLKYGLRGQVPDGMLIRVSSISNDEPRAYELQELFVRTMLGAMTATTRSRLAGPQSS